jgi:hypothetical protein
MNKKAYRYWNQNNPVFWVAGLKGKVGDWEYTADSKKAIPLSPYWQKRFNADCRAVGGHAKFVSA